MDKWRWQKRDEYYQEFTKAESCTNKPPFGNRQPTVPAWEKNFCKSVTRISWNRLMEMKKYTKYCDSVIKWNDSAGEDAFHNAKMRFYAKIHGHPCNVPLPDPDLYIDEIDWNAQIDPELVLDLEGKPEFHKGMKTFSGVVIMDSLLKDLGFSGPGWGDCEETVKNNETVVDEKGWGDFGNNTPCLDKNNGWGDGCNNNDTNSWGENGYENSNNNREERGDERITKNSWGQNKYEDKKNRKDLGVGGNSKNSWGQNKYENYKNKGECGNIGWNSKNSWVENKYGDHKNNRVGRWM